MLLFSSNLEKKYSWVYTFHKTGRKSVWLRHTFLIKVAFFVVREHFFFFSIDKKKIKFKRNHKFIHQIVQFKSNKIQSWKLSTLNECGAQFYRKLFEVLFKWNLFWRLSTLKFCFFFFSTIFILSIGKHIKSIATFCCKHKPIFVYDKMLCKAISISSAIFKLKNIC